MSPAVISRDAAGRATVRAVRLTTPLRIDGQLDEGVYQSVPSLSGFIQAEPVSGSPPTEQTEVFSELFVVYNEQRDTLARRFPELENRAFVIKITRLFRF